MMSFMSLAAVVGALESGFIYALMALGVFLSFRTLNTPDLTVDGSFVTGAAVSAVICSGGGNPIIAIVCGFFAGCAAGSLTALLNTKLKIQSLLCGILMMLALYSINLRIIGIRVPMGSNIALNNAPSIFDYFKNGPFGVCAKLIVALMVLSITLLLLFLFLKTKAGIALRATGDNEHMVRAQGINSDHMRLIGLALSNGLVAACGSMISQQQSYVDVGMGVGMVVIGLASVIIGEVLFGIKPLFRRLVAVALGSAVYRLMIAVALALGMPSTDLKLVSALIVTLALSAGIIGKRFQKIGKKLSIYHIGGNDNA